MNNRNELINFYTEKLREKTREYNLLCEELDKYKNLKNSFDESKLVLLLNKFKKNNEEIKEINLKLEEINSNI